jgi:GTP-binding protein Era
LKAGFVTLIGKPNVGKSTLLNHVVGQKVSIVSNKKQTTRRRLLGIATTSEYQIVFVDTPGVHEAHTQLGKLLNETAEQALADTDVILAVVDASKKPEREDETIAAMIKRASSPNPGGGTPRPTQMVLCLNKMDLLKAHHVEENLEAYCKLFGTTEYMLTTMTKGHNADKLVDLIVSKLPESDLLFPEDDITDQPMRVMAAEIIREKALRLTRQEVPHALATVVDEWEEREDGLTRITASIVVEKDGQKAILIGKKGAMLKQIGTESRLEIESWTGTRVFLELFVKVRTDWRQNPRMLRDLEYT